MEDLPWTCTFGEPPNIHFCDVNYGGLLSNGKAGFSRPKDPHFVPDAGARFGPAPAPFPGPPSDSWETHGKSKQIWTFTFRSFQISPILKTYLLKQLLR